MRERPPATILEFLERMGVRLSLNLYGQVNELYPREATWLAPYVREALPVIKAELQRRAVLNRRGRRVENGPAPEPGPRINQVRVTHLFRGINLVEAFVGEAQWVELGWARRARDGRKIGAQKLLALSVGTEPAGPDDPGRKGTSAKE